MMQSLWGRNFSESLRILKRLSFLFFLLSIFFLVKNLLFSELNLINLAKLKIATAEIDRRIGIEEEKNKRLKLVYNKIKKDPAYFRDKFIREYLHMFREGEKVIPLDKSLWYRHVE